MEIIEMEQMTQDLPFRAAKRNIGAGVFGIIVGIIGNPIVARAIAPNTDIYEGSTLAPIFGWIMSIVLPLAGVSFIAKKEVIVTDSTIALKKRGKAKFDLNWDEVQRLSVAKEGRGSGVRFIMKDGASYDVDESDFSPKIISSMLATIQQYITPKYPSLQILEDRHGW